MSFEKNNIFENNEINKTCDFIYNQVTEVYGNCNSLMIVGSVARQFSGVLYKDYLPKDLDIGVDDYYVFRFLRNNLQKWFPNNTLSIEDRRLILHTDQITIEFWINLKDLKSKNITKNILYKDYGNTI